MAKRIKKASYDSGFDSDVMSFIEDTLYRLEGMSVYGSDLPMILTEGPNSDGAWIVGTYNAWEYIAEHRLVASDTFEYVQDNLGFAPNPLEDPEGFTFFMLDYGVGNILGSCPALDELWDEEFELTPEVIERIIASCDQSRAARRRAHRRAMGGYKKYMAFRKR